jgi:hypothetical protein
MKLKATFSRVCSYLAVLSILITGSVNAAIVTPVSVEASSNVNNYHVKSIINGSGLNSGNGKHSAGWPDMWLGNSNGGLAWLTFDLGGVFSIASSDIWQYSKTGSEDRGARDLEILGSTDGIDFTSITNTTLAKSVNGAEGILAQNILFNAISETQYVRFEILSNYGHSSYVGLSEVKFNSAPYVASSSISAVPVPAAAWLFGTALIGLFGFNKPRETAPGV